MVRRGHTRGSTCRSWLCVRCGMGPTFQSVSTPRRYNFNDGYVTPITPDDIVTPASYMLFYKHRGLDASASQSRIVTHPCAQRGLGRPPIGTALRVYFS